MILGIHYILKEVSKDDLHKEIEKANEDPSIHGILVYYPCFGPFPCFYGGTMDDFLRDSICIKKDVEGLGHFYRSALYHNRRYANDKKTKRCVLPCTPMAIVKVLEYLSVYQRTLPRGDRLQGKRITIFNRSDIVGRPLAAMLANDGADVYSIDIDSLYLFQRGRLIALTEDKGDCCRKSDVIVTGVPSKDFTLPSSFVSENTVIINVSAYKNVNEVEILKIKGVKYVPLVGKVTVAMLERNLMRLYENFHFKREKFWQGDSNN